MTVNNHTASYQMLVVDDDHLNRSLIGTYLESAGHQVVTAASGKEMFACLAEQKFDLIILDLTLPDEDGIVLARKLRARSTIPIIILTARDNIEDRCVALEVGADDYLTKSIDPKEFILRVRNLLRRSTGDWANKSPSTNFGSRIFEFDGWQLDTEGFELKSPEGELIIMTPMEIKLLSVLVQNTGRVLSRDRLLDAISGYDSSPSERMVDAFVSRIRKKIESDSSKPKKIVTVTGVGYKFEH